MVSLFFIGEVEVLLLFVVLLFGGLKIFGEVFVLFSELFVGIIGVSVADLTEKNPSIRVCFEVVY